MMNEIKRSPTMQDYDDDHCSITPGMFSKEGPQASVSEADRSHDDIVEVVPLSTDKPSEKDWGVLADYIKKGHLGDVRSWFESRGLGPNARLCWTVNSKWPLLVAATTGSVAVLDVLLEYGFHPSETHYFGDCLIHAAAGEGHVDMVERLCQLGLHVHMEDSDENTPLHFAAKTTNDNSRMVNFLIGKRADPNAKNQIGETPLHVASGKGSLTNVTALLEAGAKVNIRTYQGASPMFYAINRKTDMEEHARVLCEMGANSVSCHGKFCEFRAACGANNLPILILLIDRNFCMSCKSSMMKYTPLYQLIATMNSEHRSRAVDLIVEAGYDIHSEINWIKHQVLYPLSVTGIETLHNKLLMYASNPRTLRKLSCNTIRKCLDGRLTWAVDCLPLPNILKDALRMKHSL